VGAELADPFDFDGVSFSWPAGGAESFDGRGLSSFSGFNDVPSPRRGVGLDEFFASCVFGFDRVPRTDLEWELSTILEVFAVLDVVVLGVMRGSSLESENGVWLWGMRSGELKLMNCYLGSYIIDRRGLEI
jgi:hypothetical protein